MAATQLLEKRTANHKNGWIVMPKTTRLETNEKYSNTGDFLRSHRQPKVN
jgi:hypothetical protein